MLSVWREKKNYGKILELTLSEITSDGKRPSLLLHACCAPCSSYVIEYLSEYFDITLLYYNPNISPADEYEKRSEDSLSSPSFLFVNTSYTSFASRIT